MARFSIPNILRPVLGLFGTHPTGDEDVWFNTADERLYVRRPHDGSWVLVGPVIGAGESTVPQVLTGDGLVTERYVLVVPGASDITATIATAGIYTIKRAGVGAGNVTVVGDGMNIDREASYSLLTPNAVATFLCYGSDIHIMGASG